jgi:hypothetical protein
VIWCRHLLAAIGEAQSGPTIIYSDSQSAMRLAVNLEFYANTKHIDIKYHSLGTRLSYFLFVFNIFIPLSKPLIFL